MVMNKLRKPLIDAENRMRADSAKHYAVQLVKHEIAESRLKSIKDSQSSIKSKSKLSPATDADLDAAIDEVLSTVPDPEPLLLVGGDATPDRLTELLQLHGFVNVLDAEGTIFNHFSGKKHNTGASWETLLAATTGDQLKTHRIGRGDGVANDPSLVMCLAVQPDVWLSLKNDNSAANRGVVGRFLPLVADKWRGNRDHTAIEKYRTNQTLNDQWENIILQILNNKTERVLELTAKGFRLFQNVREVWERKIGDDDYYLNGFGSRIVGNLATISMLFTLMKNPAADKYIDDDALEMALALLDPLVDHRRFSDNIKIEASAESRILDRLCLFMDETDSLTGDMGTLKRTYKYLTRELYQSMKRQKWIMDGGMDAFRSALANLEIKCWLDFDSDNHILLHPDLRKHHRERFRAYKMPNLLQNA